mgnify:CR=1 FL=1|jgi:hypothetical protein
MDKELDYLEALETFLEDNSWFVEDDNEPKTEKEKSLMYWATVFNSIY